MLMRINIMIAATALTMTAASALAQDTSEYTPSPEEVDRIAAELPQLMLHPLYAEPYVCSEHPFSTSMRAGDALGQDCMIVNGIDWATNSGFMAYYAGDGSRNTDWYGWGKPVFAPSSGTVSGVHVNETVNEPGEMIRGFPTSFSIVDGQGNVVVLAHLGQIVVEDGQTVAVGDLVGTVGNNGNSRSPHIHVGASTADGKPAQIRWNLVSSALRARDYISRMREESQAAADDPAPQ